MLDFFKAIILGVVEGLTEFIPVSSTGHLIVVGDLLQFTSDFAKTFDIAIQLGAIFSVIIVYKSEFREYVRLKPNLKIFPNIFQIAVCILPALALGYLLHKPIKEYLFTPTTVAFGLILGSFLMISADYYQRTRKKSVTIGYGRSFMVGLIQCLSLWPGFSRSGATISGGILFGMDYKKASAFSFICAVPIMICATAYELLKTTTAMTSQEVFILIVGAIVSFVVGWFSIVFFLKLIQKIKLLPFAIYRIILAIIILYTASANAETALIETKTSKPDFIYSAQSVLPLETIKNDYNDTFLHFVSSESLKQIQTESIKQNFKFLNTSSMFLRFKALPEYLTLRQFERKKQLFEVILGSEKSYAEYKKLSTSIVEVKTMLKKYSIQDETLTRIYIELCIENPENSKTSVLWSTEANLTENTLTQIQTPIISLL